MQNVRNKCKVGLILDRDLSMRGKPPMGFQLCHIELDASSQTTCVEKLPY